MIVWTDAAIVKERISRKYKTNFTYFTDTSTFALKILISYFWKY